MTIKLQYGNDALGPMVTTPSTVYLYPNPFTYNPKSEITNAILAANNFDYAYDPIGNRVTATKNQEPENYSANQLNQYTQIGDGVTNFPTYDLDGNMLTYNGWMFTWNGENRLIQASNATHVISYSYDYQGRMFQKIVDGVTNSYVWDGFNIVAELAPGQTNFNVWGLDLSGTIQGAGGIGGLLSVTMPSAPCPMHFPLADGNGNITEYVTTNGTVVAHREYSAFGETLVLTGTKQDDFTFWFSTKPYDPLTKISHYQLRDYWAEMGRWLSRDPIEEGGPNLYGFVRNTPIAYVDMLGLLNVIAAKRRTSSDPSWDQYSQVIFQSLANLAAEIAAFGGKDKFDEPCKLVAGVLSGPSLKVFHYNESLGAPEGPDYGVLWTKAIISESGGTPLGMTKAGILEGKKPRCNLCWYGSYVKEWLTSQKLGGESWIQADSGVQLAAISGVSVVSRIAALFNAYECCRKTKEGAEIMVLKSEGADLPEPIPGFPIKRYFKLKILTKPCKDCKAEKPFKCLL